MNRAEGTPHKRSHKSTFERVNEASLARLIALWCTVSSMEQSGRTHHSNLNQSWLENRRLAGRWGTTPKPSPGTFSCPHFFLLKFVPNFSPMSHHSIYYSPVRNDKCLLADFSPVFLCGGVEISKSETFQAVQTLILRLSLESESKLPNLALTV